MAINLNQKPGGGAGTIDWTDITNKPTIPSTTTQIFEGLNQYYTNTRADSRIALQKGQPNGLATLDVDSKIPSFQIPAIETIDWTDITNKPTIPTQTSQLSNDSNFINTNDSRLSDSRSPTGTAGGDLMGTYPNPELKSKVVAYANIQNTAASRLLGNPTATAASPTEIALTGGLSFTGTSITANRGAANGMCDLDSTAKIPLTRLPSATSFVPGIRGLTTAGSYTSSGDGRVLRFNNICHINCRLIVTEIATAGTGQIIITGLPFTVAVTPGIALQCFINTNNSGIFDFIAYPTSSSANLGLFKRSGGALAVTVPSDVGNNFDISIHGLYLI